MAAQMQGKVLEHYQDLWNQYDKNRDGRLEKTEFTSMISKSGVLDVVKRTIASWVGGPRVDPESLFEFADIDGSGYVEFNEFCAIMFNPEYLDDRTKTEILTSAFYSLSEGDEKLSLDQCSRLFSGEVNQATTEGFFSIMDASANGFVNLSDFIDFVNSIWGCSVSDLGEPINFLFQIFNLKARCLS